MTKSHLENCLSPCVYHSASVASVYPHISVFLFPSLPLYVPQLMFTWWLSPSVSQRPADVSVCVCVVQCICEKLNQTVSLGSSRTWTQRWLDGPLLPKFRTASWLSLSDGVKLLHPSQGQICGSLASPFPLAVCYLQAMCWQAGEGVIAAFLGWFPIMVWLNGAEVLLSKGSKPLIHLLLFG